MCKVCVEQSRSLHHFVQNNKHSHRVLDRSLLHQRVVSYNTLPLRHTSGTLASIDSRSHQPTAKTPSFAGRERHSSRSLLGEGRKRAVILHSTASYIQTQRKSTNFNTEGRRSIQPGGGIPATLKPFDKSQRTTESSTDNLEEVRCARSRDVWRCYTPI